MRVGLSRRCFKRFLYSLSETIDTAEPVSTSILTFLPSNNNSTWYPNLPFPFPLRMYKLRSTVPPVASVSETFSTCLVEWDSRYWVHLLAIRPFFWHIWHWAVLHQHSDGWCFGHSENKHLSPNLDTWDWKNGLFCLSNLSRRNTGFVELLLIFQLPRLCCFKCFCERQIFLCQQLLLNVVTVKSNRKEDMLTILKLPSKTRPCFEVKGETLDYVSCFPFHCFRALACYCVLYNRMKHSQGFFIF